MRTMMQGGLDESSVQPHPPRLPARDVSACGGLVVSRLRRQVWRLCARLGYSDSTAASSRSNDPAEHFAGSRVSSNDPVLRYYA